MTGTVDPARHELKAAMLRRECSPETLPFETTDDLAPSDGLIGQDRAVKALEFGLGVEVDGYGIFVLGPTGTGKTTYTRSLLERLAKEKPTPPDWCYVHNFARPEQPNAIALPAGTGPRLKQDIERLIRTLRVKIPEAFGSESYQKQVGELKREFFNRTQLLMQQAEQAAESRGFAIRGTPSGLTTLPLGPDGQPLSPEAYETMGGDEQKALTDRAQELQDEMAAVLRKVSQLERQYRDKQEALDRKVVIYAVDPVFQELAESYGDNEEIARHLKDVRRDIVQNLDEFKRTEETSRPAKEGESPPWPFPPGGPGRSSAQSPFSRYQVNVLVSQKGEGAPVVFETNPTYFNLGGKMEYRGEFGHLATDFSMLSPGALHRANGGYLILNARDVLVNPGSWDLLKRSLLTRELRIENPVAESRAAPTAGLQPEPIPLKVKVVMLGGADVYHLLHALDPDFRKLFKVKAEFDYEMPRGPGTEADYAAFVASLCRRQGLRPFDRAAVARVIEYGSRLASDQDKLSLLFNELAEVVYEADAWSRARSSSGGEVVRARDVEKALEEKEYRSRLIAEKLQEMLARGEILVDLEGAKVGQVNGLAVLDTGDYAFGKPSRLTAETYMGSEGVINIEREALLSGKVHDKGVLILQGHLAARFAQDKPLSLSATVCFEQSYAGVDGDSASLAELCALISSLAGVPLRQAVAVTGSVNQKGEVQPVGGLDQKIEGFFDVCRARGLTGEQGVIVPRRSASRLMLRPDVVETVREGGFHVWAVDTVDEALEVLTGMPAGSRGPDGVYPEGTVNRLADDKLRRYSERLAELRGYKP